MTPPTRQPSIVDALPKAELHLHLEGSIRPETAVELAARHGTTLTAHEVTARYNYADFAGFIDVFKWVTSFLREPEDYALITRFFEKGTGQPFLALGGINSAGTIAAAECVTSSECIDAVVANAPSGWEQKNMQIVLSAKVVAGAPGAPEILAVYFW